MCISIITTQGMLRDLWNSSGSLCRIRAFLDFSFTPEALNIAGKDDEMFIKVQKRSFYIGLRVMKSKTP
ncbi:hypothetical protein ACFL1N_08220 [Thermodesulfobacteriota bacterium]